MDRNFMKDFYNNYYEDAIHTATESDEYYVREMKKRTKMSSEFTEILRGLDPSVLEKYDVLMAQYYKLEGIAALDIYLMGAADRDKMLR